MAKTISGACGIARRLLPKKSTLRQIAAWSGRAVGIRIAGDHQYHGTLAMRFITCAIAALIYVAASGLSAGAHSLEEVEQQQLAREPYVEIDNRPAPAFVLEDSTGRAVSLADSRGKVVVLYFIYATCPDICPLHTQKIVEIQERVNLTPMLDQVQFVAITTDPAQDTPDVLEQYMADQAVDRRNYVFLTSGADRPDLTRELAAQYRLAFTPTDDGNQVHGAVTNVIDREGNLRARYHGLNFNPTNVALFVNALTNDVDVHPASAGARDTQLVAPNRAWSARQLTQGTIGLAGLFGAAALVGFVFWRRRGHRNVRN
ncbi:MAG: SCO family protein [Alphaproteobacteria bacterium]